MHSPRIPGFAADSVLCGAASTRLTLAPHLGPKEGGEVLPYVKLVEYDPRWPAVFEVEKQRIIGLTGNKIAAVEHFGSTSIPRICAKPCIDILVGLNEWKLADKLQYMLSRFDYRYIAGLQDWRILGRTGSPAFRLHLLPYQNFRWKGFVALRDHLRSNARVASDYCRIKKHLAVTYLTDRLNYNQGKRTFLDNVGELARKHILASRLVSRRISR